MRSSPPISRDHETYWLYAAVSLGTFGATGLGVVLLPLSQDLAVPYTSVSYYPALYAAANVVTGFIGGSVVRRMGLHATGILGIVLLLAGAASFILPTTVTLAPVLLGFGGAFISIMVPARLAQLYGIHTAMIQAEANATSSAVSIAPSMLVSAALAMGLSWKLGFVAPTFIAGGVLLAMAATLQSSPERPLPEPLPEATGSQTVARPMIGLFLAVTVEFAVVYWAAPVTQEWFDISSSLAVLSSGTFIAGVASGRVLARGFIRAYSAPRLVFGGTAVAFTGFWLFFFSAWYGLALPALLIMGWGVSVFYPVLVTRMMAAFPTRRERGAQLALFSAGLASGASPWLLGVLTNVVSVRMALLVVPLYLIALALIQPGAVSSLRRARRAPVA